MSKQVLEKCLNVKLQPEHKCRLHPLQSRSTIIIVAAISEKRIGKMDYSKPSKQSKERNE
jgi:hypothetical protein